MHGPPPPPLRGIVEALQLRVDFPLEVLAEVEALLRAPGIDDPALVDRTALPFVTVDGPSTKDLDQALFIDDDGDGWAVWYAIADVTHFVRPGSALFAESLRRGASYYLPGYSVPMLPRELSEGLVSLNPGVERRALLFHHRVKRDGQLAGTRIERARIRSRAKLTFDEVQALAETNGGPLAGAEFEASLKRLPRVAQARLRLAEERGVVRYRREEVRLTLDGEGVVVAAMEALRDGAEAWNEQLSLMCNAEGGRLLRDAGRAAVQPVYRVQPGPAPSRLAALARLTEAAARRHGLDAAVWAWHPDDAPLAEYLRRLPIAAPGSKEDRVARALARQAVMVNLRSEYSTEPGPHTGVGAEPYARFSAPMRELVGVYLHKEAVELLTGVAPPAEEDEALRAQVVKVANQSRQTQRKVTDLANELVLDRVFRPELSRPRAERRRFVGTVMGVAPGKVHVRLDEPPMDVKLYFFDLAKAFDGAWLEVADDGAALLKKGSTTPLLLLGQAVTLVLDGRDEKAKRWVLRPA
ncbi:MAG: RNB domain-containing ribonuclease [Myxococcota bacterium]